MKMLQLLLCLPLALGTQSHQEHLKGTPHYRRTFHTGGTYRPSPINDSQQILSGQLYTEHLTPLHPNPRLPLVLLLHGSAQLGTNFLTTPDGRPGWADYFLKKGYDVMIPDQIYNGRSSAPIDAELVSFDAEFIEQVFTATKRYGLWYQAELHTQWPGNGSRGDKVFDRFYRANVPIEADGVLQQVRMKEALVQLVEEQVPKGREVVIVAHSQAGFWGWTVTEALGKKKVKGVVILEPPGPPFKDKVLEWLPPPTRIWGLGDIALKYDPPLEYDMELVRNAVRVGEDTDERSSCLLQKEPPKKLIGLKDIPALVVTAEASYHAVYDHCTVDYLKQAGVGVDHYRLEDYRIKGNGHMFFMEKNSDQSVRLVEKWIRKL